ncbi:MAG: multidrug efflux RND transporter permease subunit [Alphaproteobacteria bacterium]|nr:multidrug efflux RND transporter permease subunit [Alphaproteobacteria bacterium]
MKFSHFFIERPIFASVLSIVIVVLGGISYFSLAISQYPEVAPPTIQVSASYPGASAETVAETVASPIEQEINGVDNMLYIESQSTGDGNVSITVTFELGTDLDAAQVLVQNRVAIALPRLPESVRALGVTTRKNSPDIMLVAHLLSPDGSLDHLYVSNYAYLKVKDELTRIKGVGDVRIYGAREYSMRVWLDPQRMAELGLIVDDITAALQQQNVQVAAGAIGQEPMSPDIDFRLTVEAQGRLARPKEFEQIIVKRGEDGSITRLRDIARVELSGYDYATNSYLDGQEAAAILVFQSPGSNALATSEAVKAKMEELKKNFPKGLDYKIAYNPTEFIQQSVDAVLDTILEAIVLVVIVIILFLKTWRAAVIPIVAIPISLIGTFLIMAAVGFSLNNLTLFGLVLAIGIVVDDAIVVVENVERNLRKGMSPRQAAHRTMDEVSTALIAISLVLMAVFIPTAFVTGIAGQFYRQFAVTIAASTAISLVISLTLSPALAAMLLRPHDANEKHSLIMRPIHAFFRGFDRSFDALSNGYGGTVKRLVRLPLIVLIVYGGLIYVAAETFQKTPSGFVPAIDQGYFITVVQTPAGSSLDRTDAVVKPLAEKLKAINGISHVVALTGLDGATFTLSTNGAALFTTLMPFKEREAKGISADAIYGQMWGVVSQIQEAQIFVIKPPPIRGIGTGGGFKLYVLDRNGQGSAALQQATQTLAGAANGDPQLTQVFSFFNTSTPSIYADIDRQKAEMLNVPLERIFSALSTFLGSQYVNDINLFGRTYRVRMQADEKFRDDVSDIGKLWTRNMDGEMVPIGAVASFEDRTNAYRVPRFNLSPGAAIQGSTIPGISTGQAIVKMEALADKVLPDGFTYQWTEIAYQEKQAGNTAIYVFGAAVLFVFLLLAAQYESWLLPLAVILIVPMCLLAAMLGVNFRGYSNDILVQVGLIVLVALAAKNAILIVEFARQAEEEGMTRFEAAVEAAKTRLRPILMTSFAFILGVTPLVIAKGAGAEMRQVLGTAVFSGMIGVTIFGLIFTPVFYTVCQKFARKPREPYKDFGTDI